MTATPKGFRLHIGIFGRRNVGKSTLLNLLAGQEVSIVSPTAGTTTDPVEKPMEFIPMGPVLWIDTAGIDDVGDLGQLRTAKAEGIIERTDLALIVFVGTWGGYE
ncbi:MAG: 50S ribosome-binding GTPase, partial [Planctomycetes bacterium]|nr:50S ribosome-binding GTPase [Planctomycetota bacterium]